MNKNKVYLVLFSITLPFLLMLFSYKISLLLLDLTPDQRQTMDFLQGERELDLPYTEAEMAHLHDVKRIMNLADIVFYVFLFIDTILITSFKRKKEQLEQMFLYGGITTLAAAGMILLLAFTQFNSLFTVFHQLFFPQGNWVFAVESLIIQTFPLDFFIVVSRSIFIQTLVYGSFFIVLSLFLRNGVLSRNRS